jgi:hypothetical protein
MHIGKGPIHEGLPPILRQGITAGWPVMENGLVPAKGPRPQQLCQFFIAFGGAWTGHDHSNSFNEFFELAYKSIRHKRQKNTSKYHGRGFFNFLKILGFSEKIKFFIFN